MATQPDETLRLLYTNFNKYNGLTSTQQQNSGVDIQSITKEIDSIQKLLISKGYPNDQNSVRVDYINASLGKSVFLTKDINNLQQPVFTELPLVSNLYPIYFDEKYKSCFHCLKSIHVDTKCYSEKIQKTKGLPFLKSDNSDSSNKSITCDKNCKFEIYCSEKCKKVAWDKYHCVLCPTYEFVLKLYGFCKIKNQVFPLIIMKMIATVISDLKNNNKSIQDALLPFTLFQYDLNTSTSGSTDDEPKLTDDQLICFAFIVDIFKPILNDQLFNQLINKKRYYQFNSILKLNSSNIEPISLLCEYLDTTVSITPMTQDYIMFGDNVKLLINDIGQFIQDNNPDTISIKGAGLYKIINSINHSCEPNVLCTFTKNDHAMTLHSTQSSKLLKGQELNISYINQDLSFPTRQKLLIDNYSFKCNCKKCKTGK